MISKNFEVRKKKEKEESVREVKIKKTKRKEGKIRTGSGRV